MYIIYVKLRLFSALSRRVGALQIFLIIIIIRDCDKRWWYSALQVLNW